MKGDDRITAAEAAEILKVSRPRVRQFVASGKLATAGTFGTSTVFSKAVVKAFKRTRDAAKRNGRKKRDRTKS